MSQVPAPSNSLSPEEGEQQLICTWSKWPSIKHRLKLMSPHTEKGFSSLAEDICESDELRGTMDSALHQNTEPQLCQQFGILMDRELSAMWDFTAWFER